MIHIRSRSVWGFTCASVLVTALTAMPCPAIEMFTFFGDGSRIGLPSLEVPIEAYRGIPLRSDRLRARRAGRQPAGSQAAARPGGGLIQVIPETAVPIGEVEPSAALPAAPGIAPRLPQPETPHRVSSPPVAPDPPAAVRAMPAAESIPRAGFGPARR
jgi:hypothetical protein